MNSTAKHLPKSLKRDFRSAINHDPFISINIDKYDPAHVKAWGYAYQTTQINSVESPISYYAAQGGLPELYSHFEAGMADAVGTPQWYTITDIATQHGVTRQYIHQDIQAGRLRAFLVGGRWLVRSRDYAAWHTRRTAHQRAKRRTVRRSH